MTSRPRTAAASPPSVEPIWPVSLHYFLRDDARTPRAIPADVTKRTDAYKAALPLRCEHRKPVAPAGAADGVHGAPDGVHRVPDGVHRVPGSAPDGVHGAPGCLANPLATGCS